MLLRRPSIRYGRTPEPETPFQKASQAWDERIGSARVQARNWRLPAFGNLFLAAGLSGGPLLAPAGRNLTPLVGRGGKNRQAPTPSPPGAGYPPDQPQIALALARLLQ